MPRGFLSVRIDAANERHHLWLNNGTWWVHYTLNFDFRTRRVRRSLETAVLAEAIRRRDALFERLTMEGEWVPERDPEPEPPSNHRAFSGDNFALRARLAVALPGAS